MRRPLDVLVLALLVASLPAIASAYIDPGSGALLLQAIVAGVAGAAFMLRQHIRRALGWLRPGRRPAPPAGAAPPGEPGRDDR